MKIAVMGAVGCYYGFSLARAGLDVVLTGRPQHVEAIERHGLRLETQTFDEHASLHLWGALQHCHRNPIATEFCLQKNFAMCQKEALKEAAD
jgi:ketopantoate reductase